MTQVSTLNFMYRRETYHDRDEEEHLANERLANGNVAEVEVVLRRPAGLGCGRVALVLRAGA